MCKVFICLALKAEAKRWRALLNSHPSGQQSFNKCTIFLLSTICPIAFSHFWRFVVFYFRLVFHFFLMYYPFIFSHSLRSNMSNQFLS
jgi:hypothetical protein